MNEGDCLKLHGKIDADDNARHTVPVIVFLFLHLPHTYRHLHQPGHCEGRHPKRGMFRWSIGLRRFLW